MSVLYIIATPIGNLKDITLRALETLKEVDLILCEDTRQTIKLLSHYGISKSLASYFQHSKISKINYIIEQLKQNKKLALVTDAGTPGISDPAGKLVETISVQLPSCQIISIPGPSALVAALSVSGFPADKFVFMGFPPAKKGREKFFKKVLEAEYTVVFYESPHRILKSLRDLRETPKQSKLATGQADAKSNAKQTRKIVVCRELTKKFETIYRGNIDEVMTQLTVQSKEADKSRIKGEFVVVINKTKYRLSQNKV